MVIASVTHTFPPASTSGNPYASVAFESFVDGLAAPASPGDEIILKFSTISGSSYIPNGDGAIAGARVPNLTLP
jgi:hypothetical protein